MRVRVRGPTGQSILTLDEGTSMDEFRALVRDRTGLADYDVKYGYPTLQPLPLDRYRPDLTVAELGVNLNGEQLIVTPRMQRPPDDPPRSDSRKSAAPAISTPARAATGTPFSSSLSHPVALVGPKRAAETDRDPPEIPSPEHGGTVVLRIMPDDNSCLFRAVGGAVIGSLDAMTELRAIVAQTIQEQPDVYPEVMLERKRDDYCRWIQTEAAWGGAIELSILSKHFDIEICSIDVQSLRVDRFNEGRPMRCIVVYSGIHYDTIALSPSDPPYTRATAPPEFDTTVFDAANPVILTQAGELCRILQGRHYYTDTAGFHIRCQTCGDVVVGEQGATQHAMQTGHTNFGEAD